MTSYYQPTYIRKYEGGLVESRENFLLPNDAYPVLENAYIWRERILRKPGYRLLGRLRRVLTAQALGNLDGAGNFSGNIRVILSLESTGEIEVGSLVITDGVNTFTDNGLGVLVGVPGGSGTINYSTMAITITGGAPGAAITASFNYFPGLPTMGLRSRELSNINSEQTIAFDTVYAYRYSGGWQEFIPGTTWTGTDSDFFWSTNYWVGDSNIKIFWVTNFVDPIRYTNGVNWVDFTPQLNAAGDVLDTALAILPFRGRLLVFNTFENLVQYRQRIRWSAIGNPFTIPSAVVTTVNANAWRDDIPGQGGFLDIPTAEDIVTVGFVRDNLVIYCERSTWQLRYTGRSIAPFQIEKINTELGAESTFSTVQFDTSLVGIGDKGVVECDSYQSSRIDIKIPDLVFTFNNETDGLKRVHGIRDFQQRIAYWTFPTSAPTSRYPNRRLVYNYENDSWAIFTDSFTCLGTYQPQTSLRWSDFPNTATKPTNTWEIQNYPWINEQSQFPAIIGGNQQGYVEYLGQANFQFPVTNDVSLSITNITGLSTQPVVITSPSHNLQTGQVIQIGSIPTGTPYATLLNGSIFMVSRIDANSFNIYSYNPATLEFSTLQFGTSGTYIGGGEISIRDNFKIQSKKFNFLDEGQTVHFGFMDILMNKTDSGAITLNMYMDYNDTQPTNTFPQNSFSPFSALDSDTFFNSVIPTYPERDTGSSKYWQRVYCNTRGSFITLEFTFSNAQMAGSEYAQDVQIDTQVLWMRPAGRQLTTGV